MQPTFIDIVTIFATQAAISDTWFRALKWHTVTSLRTTAPILRRLTDTYITYARVKFDVAAYDDGNTSFKQLFDVPLRLPRAVTHRFWALKTLHIVQRVPWIKLDLRELGYLFVLQDLTLEITGVSMCSMSYPLLNPNIILLPTELPALIFPARLQSLTIVRLSPTYDDNMRGLFVWVPLPTTVTKLKVFRLSYYAMLSDVMPIHYMDTKYMYTILSQVRDVLSDATCDQWFIKFYMRQLLMFSNSQACAPIASPHTLECFVFDAAFQFPMETTMPLERSIITRNLSTLRRLAISALPFSVIECLPKLLEELRFGLIINDVDDADINDVDDADITYVRVFDALQTAVPTLRQLYLAADNYELFIDDLTMDALAHLPKSLRQFTSLIPLHYDKHAPLPTADAKTPWPSQLHTLDVCIQGYELDAHDIIDLARLNLPATVRSLNVDLFYTSPGIVYHLNCPTHLQLESMSSRDVALATAFAPTFGIHLKYLDLVSVRYATLWTMLPPQLESLRVHFDEMLDTRVSVLTDYVQYYDREDASPYIIDLCVPIDTTSDIISATTPMHKRVVCVPVHLLPRTLHRLAIRTRYSENAIGLRARELSQLPPYLCALRANIYVETLQVEKQQPLAFGRCISTMHSLKISVLRAYEQSFVTQLSEVTQSQAYANNAITLDFLLQTLPTQLDTLNLQSCAYSGAFLSQLPRELHSLWWRGTLAQTQRYCVPAEYLRALPPRLRFLDIDCNVDLNSVATIRALPRTLVHFKYNSEATPITWTVPMWQALPFKCSMIRFPLRDTVLADETNALHVQELHERFRYSIVPKV